MSKVSLSRELGFFDSTAIVVGTIIGSGIFLVPGSVAASIDSLGFVLLAWLMGGLLSLCGALSLAEMGAALPGSGGLYVYLREAYGRPAGFLYGWGLLTAIHSGSIATLAAAFSLYMAQFFSMSLTFQKVTGITCIFFLTLVNCFGLHAGKLLQNIFTSAKLGGLILLITLLLSRGLSLQVWQQNPAADPLADSRWLSFGLALVAVLWAYEGWHVLSFAAEEIKNPSRTLPRSLVLGTMIITTVYMLANIAYYSVLTGAEIRATDTVAATALIKAFGHVAAGFVSLLILISIFGAMNGMVLTGPRVYYAMAKDGVFFRAFGLISPRYRTPIPAIIIQGIWASTLTVIGNFQDLFAYVIFTAWIFYGATVAGVIVLRFKKPLLARPFRMPGFPWPPLFFCLAAFGITFNTIFSDPGHALLGIAVIFLGLPTYFLATLKWKSRSPEIIRKGRRDAKTYK